MDPLSITVSTLALLTAVRKSVKTAKSFYGAPEQLDSLLNDLTDSEIVIRNVESTLIDRQSAARIPKLQLDHATDKLATANGVLLELRDFIQKHMLQKSAETKVKRAAWVVAKGRVAKLKKKLESVCDDLQEALGEMKTSSIELELQQVSVDLSEAVAAQNKLLAHAENIDELVRIQSKGQEELLRTTSETQLTLTRILAKSEAIEKYMLTDNLPSVASRPKLKSQSSEETLVAEDPPPRYERVAVHATQRRMVCNRENCACTCHSGSRQETPQTLRRLLGDIFAGYTGQPTPGTTCTNPMCSRRRSSAASVTYYFPRWWVAMRMMNLVAKMTAMGTPDFALNIPRIVPPTARIFRHAGAADIPAMREMFATGLASPVDTDAKTGINPLHMAVFFVNEQSLKYLLHRGADRNLRSFEGLSAIEEAWSRLLTDSVTPSQRLILSSICDSETLENFNFTSLHCSILHLSPTPLSTSLRALLLTPSTINDTDMAGRTPLSWAAQRGDISAVTQLLAAGADPNHAPSPAKTPLHFAAGMSADPPCVSALLRHGADPRRIDIAGMTPLMWACVNARTSFASVAELAGVSDLGQRDINGRSALFHAASTGVAPTEELLGMGADVDCRDDEGFAAVHMAVNHNKYVVLERLLEAGADVGVVTDAGHTLLHHAALYAERETLGVLMGAWLRGVDPGARDNAGCVAEELLASRVPQPTEELVGAFRVLVAKVAELNESPSMAASVAESEETVETVDWATASEGSLEDLLAAAVGVEGLELGEIEREEEEERGVWRG